VPDFGNFFFFKADTKDDLEAGIIPFSQDLLKRRRLQTPPDLPLNAIGFQKLSSSSHSLMGLNTSEEAEGRNVFNPIDLLKSSKDSQL